MKPSLPPRSLWRTPRKALLFLAGTGIVGLQACAVVPPEGLPEGPPATSLSEDLGALREDFNGHIGQTRVVAFLSPTCSYSALSLEALQEALEGEPSADVRVLVVWLDELPGDCVDAGRFAAMRLQDPRVAYFHDDRRRASMVLARQALPTAAVSRTVLCYEPGTHWGVAPPQPVRVAHQMGRIAPGDYCSPEELPGVLSGEWHLSPTDS